MAAPVTAVDPVCGMTVDTSNAAATVEHKGTTYHFCAKHCAEKFQANPDSYLENGPTGMDDEPASYRPLAVVIGMILLVAAVLGVRDQIAGEWSLTDAIHRFMVGFFLVFAGFKLVDLKGFAAGYQTYDLLASRVPAYGYVYPFIELGFGLAMILWPTNIPLLWAEVAVMSFSGLGVAIKLAKKEPFQCACLGTFLKVPLTKVTLIEDFGMAGLAGLMIFLL